jgi:hypothetical protein
MGVYGSKRAVLPMMVVVVIMMMNNAESSHLFLCNDN